MIALAREFAVVTPYTATLILEDEEKRSVPASFRSFQELEDDLGARDKAEARLDSIRREAASESSRAGAPAVQNSIAMNDLKSSQYLGQAAQASGLEKAAPASPAAGDRASQKNNYASQARMVSGRAFYQNGTVWTDSTAQQKRSLHQKRITFAGREILRAARAESFAFLMARPWGRDGCRRRRHPVHHPKLGGQDENYYYDLS